MRGLCLILGAITLAVAGVARAEGDAPTSFPAAASRPTTMVGQAGCVRAECHIDIKDYKVVHGPVAANACDVCHLLTDAEGHKFTLAREGREMCTYCHEFDIAGLPVVHKPVETNECLGCHDPHGGQVMATLREASVPELCYRCHENQMRVRPFLHNPVKLGACTSCHPPHASRLPKLLDLSGSDLCLECHTGLDAGLASAKFRHKALDEGCTRCHDVHGSDVPMSLTKPLAELCYECHDKLKAQVADAQRTHSPVTQGRSCMTCHTPHAGDLAGLMADLPVRICAECHDEPVKAQDGRVVAAVPELSDPAMSKHGPIKEGQCDGCHNAHGGDRAFLLAGALSPARHQAFSPERYDLCFECHETALAEQQQTVTATGFRDGDRNLHYVHVTADQRGRNCLLCHDTHAAAGARLVPATIRYGQWEMPINFAKTETGGTCMPGCHLPLGYDRQTPLAVSGDSAGDDALPRLIRAEHERLSLSWSGLDALGRTVTVPGPAVPSIILLARAGAEQTEAAIKSLNAVVAPGSAHVVIVLSGDLASDRAASLALAVPWPVVADARGILAEQLEVRGLPMALVIGPDGMEVARATGAAGSIAWKLSPYIRTDADAAEHEPLDPSHLRPQQAGDSATRKAERLRQVAQRMLARGQAEQAQQFIDQAIRLQPDSASVQAVKIEALIELSRFDEASARLEAISAAALSPGRWQLLRGRILYGTGKLDQARTALRDALVSEPGLAEAQMLLGRIYEQQGDWQKAAEAYRQAAGGPATDRAEASSQPAADH
jgi:predicted CXXCH cytochrome family protein